MALLIGMDEAGYGPNLGPLVIGATAWEVPGDPRETDLWTAFSGVVEQTTPENNSHIQIADSKLVYSPAVGLNHLEAGVLSALAVWGGTGNSGDRRSANGQPKRFPASFREVFGQVAIRPLSEIDDEPWFAGTDHLFETPANSALTDGWIDRCHEHGIRLRAICADVVLTRRFNEETRRHDNKARAHSEMSMHLLRHVWQACEGDRHESALILADKHGGRNRYHDFLPIVFGDRFIRCHNESMEQSRYRVGQAEIRFETKSERHLPVALASMVSKYLRELAMILFNRFWIEKQAGLKKTAGYPTDARRFKTDISALQTQLGIDDEILWRER